MSYIRTGVDGYIKAKESPTDYASQFAYGEVDVNALDTVYVWLGSDYVPDQDTMILSIAVME
jgi:hypothetical protein